VLAKGRHTLTILGRKKNGRLDTFIVTNDRTFVPQ